MILKLCKDIRNLLYGGGLIAEMCYPFYALHNEILEGKDREKIELSKKWSELSKASISITHLNVSNIKLN